MVELYSELSLSAMCMYKIRVVYLFCCGACPPDFNVHFKFGMHI